MKKRSILLLSLIGCFTLAACGQKNETNTNTGINPNTTITNQTDTGVIPTTSEPVDSFSTKNVKLKKLSDENVTEDGSYNLLLKSGSEIPYISLNDGVDILNKVRHERIDGKNNTNNGFAKMEMTNDDAIITNDSNTKCTISLKDQTFKFEDFDAFLNILPSGNKPLMIADVAPEVKAIKATKIEYTKGEEVTLSLKGYDKLNIIKNDGKLYIPVALYSSIFLSTLSGMYLSYNFENLYLANQGSMSTTNLEDKKELLALGKDYYAGLKKETVTEEYALYTTQAICFDMDHFYGLKADKNFTSFYNFLETKGYLSDMLSGNVKKMDAALVYAIYDLKDGHTFLSDCSPLYKFDTQEIDKSKLNQDKVKYEEENDALKKAKIDANIDDTNVIDEANKTMFISFSGFNNVNEKIIYSGNKHNDFVYALCNAAQFSDAYKTLIEKKDTIKNVVIDLTTNDGGASDGMIYALSTLLGEVSFDLYDPLSKAHTKATYKADMNLDQKIDEKDVSLIEQGFNIIFLSSEYTFSSANAMVVGAKANNKNVITIGQKTGGGPCVVKHSASGIGTIYSSSGLNVISLYDGTTYKNIDNGEEAKYAISKDKFYDRLYIANQIKTWLNQ